MARRALLGVDLLALGHRAFAVRKTGTIGAGVDVPARDLFRRRLGAVAEKSGIGSIRRGSIEPCQILLATVQCSTERTATGRETP